MPDTTAPRASTGTHTVQAVVNYTGPMSEMPRYHANDHSRDVHVLDPRTVQITDARVRPDAPSLDREGVALCAHRSRVADYLDAEELERVYVPEICALLRAATGARAVRVVSTPVVRFGERSPMVGKLNNSFPARFVHIDYSDARGQATAEQQFAATPDRPAQLGRFVHYNVWRVLTPPPQDIPLALCDARTIQRSDLIAARAVFDLPGVPERTAESLVLRYSPAHRWLYFRDMIPQEALIFVTNESDPARPHHVAHTAFDDPSCPADAVPRSSIEIRAVAYF
jgi:hypothetical protein